MTSNPAASVRFTPYIKYFIARRLASLVGVNGNYPYYSHAHALSPSDHRLINKILRQIRELTENA